MPKETRVSQHETEQEQAGSSADAGASQAQVETGTTAAERSNLAAEIASLRQELEEEKAKSEENLKQWQRSLADFINYKRRVEQERADQSRSANTSLIMKLLPVVDDLDRAFAGVPQELRRFTWLDGITLIDRKLRSVLEQEGVAPIEALGKDFDPALHEAVMFEEGADPHRGKVVAELQKGYKLHERVIRPTLVKVGEES